MTEKSLHEQIAEDRAHYEAHPADDEWEEAPPPERTAKRPVGAMVSVRLSGEEAEEIRSAAEAEELPVSAFMRRVVLNRIHRSSACAAMPAVGFTFGNYSRVVSQVDLLPGVPLSGGLQSVSAVGNYSLASQALAVDNAPRPESSA